MDAQYVAVLDAVRLGSTAAAQETATLDFKTVGRSLPDTLRNLAEAATCFANAGGGTIVVGVEDKVAGPSAFVGSQLDPTKTVARIYELTEPALIVIVENVAYEGVELSVITVPKSPDIHQVGGVATERVGTSCKRMSAVRIATVVADRRGDDWSAKESGASLDSVSPVSEALARELLEQASDTERNSWAKLAWPDVCRRLGVVVGGRLTNAGAVLFTDRGVAHTQYVRRASNAGLLAANEVVKGPGLNAIRRSLELIESRMERTAILTPGGRQLLIGDIPEAAVREAVVNAFMHRDYRNGDAIRLEHDASRLRVTSPGGFVPGVTVDNVLTVSSRCRNLALAQAIRALGLAESAGVGVDRMYASMTAVGHQPPRFASDGLTVEAVLQGGAPNEPVARFVADLPEDRRGDPDTLLVLMYLLDHRTTTAARMSKLVQRTDAETEARLMELSAPGVGLIERTADSARSAKGEYRLVGDAIRALGPAVSYRARSGDDTDRKIVTIVGEAGTINGRMVQTMFDVQPATASRILSDLVDRGILRKTSRAARGPSVTYGPGKRFPVRRSRRTAGGGDAAAQSQLDLGLEPPP